MRSNTLEPHWEKSYLSHVGIVRWVLSNYSILATFLYTGLRKSELSNSCLEDVDLNNLVLYVRKGKGGKDRMIPMNDTLVRILKNYLEQRNKVRFRSPYFFVSVKSRSKIGATTFNHIRDVVWGDSIIFFTPHMLQHTFATLMLGGGCDVISLSKMMGHSTIQMTMRYADATPELLRSSINVHPMNT